MKYPVVGLVFLLFSSLSVTAQSMFDKVNDFDGDGRADYAVTRNENGLKVWHLWRSTAGYHVMQWGIESDTVTAGDYDGDNRTDIAVTRVGFTGDTNQQWRITTYYVASTDGSFRMVELLTFNVVGASSVMNEDYDGDGKTDVGFFQWHAIGGITFRRSSDGTTGGISMNWFQVRVGDLVGNSAAEVVSTNPNTGETTIKNVAQGGEQTIRWGVGGDRFVAADFDGDNKGEIVIYRGNGEWWTMRSSDSVVTVTRWGINGDTPVPADYDGDGKSDHAVYRPGSPSVFWVLGSTAGASAFGFGLSTDTVVTY